MGHYDPVELWSLWQREKIDVQMATGQVLQNLVRQQNAQAAASLTLYQLRDQVQAQQANIDRLQVEIKALRGDLERLQARII